MTVQELLDQDMTKEAGRFDGIINGVRTIGQRLKPSLNVPSMKGYRGVAANGGLGASEDAIMAMMGIDQLGNGADTWRSNRTAKSLGVPQDVLRELNKKQRGDVRSNFSPFSIGSGSARGQRIREYIKSMTTQQKPMRNMPDYMND